MVVASGFLAARLSSTRLGSACALLGEMLSAMVAVGTAFGRFHRVRRPLDALRVAGMSMMGTASEQGMQCHGCGRQDGEDAVQHAG